MNLIPLIYIKNRKLYQNNSNQITIKEIIQEINKETQVYFIDYDGIEKNKPNFCTYQAIAPYCKQWIDYGPRSLGDVVDIVMAGAEKITLRKNLCPYIDIPSIRKVIDSQIYQYYSLKDYNNKNIGKPTDQADGIVISANETNNLFEKTQTQNILSLVNNHQINIIEQDKNNFSYWKNKEVASIITEFSTWKKETHHE